MQLTEICFSEEKNGKKKNIYIVLTLIFFKKYFYSKHKLWVHVRTAELPQCMFWIKKKQTRKLGIRYKKVQAGKGQEKAQSEKDSPPKTEVGKNKTDNRVLIP